MTDGHTILFAVIFVVVVVVLGVVSLLLLLPFIIISFAYYCFPIAFQSLCMRAAVKELSASEKHRFNVAVNNAIRRIFGFRRWESIRQLRECYGFKSVEVIFANAKQQFLRSIANHNNCVLKSLYVFNRVD